MSASTSPSREANVSVSSETGSSSTRQRITVSAPSSNAAEFLGREHQARGRTQPQQGWTSLAKGEGGLCRRVIAGQKPAPGVACDADRRRLCRLCRHNRFVLLEGALGPAGLVQLGVNRARGLRGNARDALQLLL